MKAFDIIIEFRENMYDRWIFPRDIVACESVGSELEYDLNLKIAFSNDTCEVLEESFDSDNQLIKKKAILVDLRIRNVSNLLKKHLSSFVDEVSGVLKEVRI